MEESLAASCLGGVPRARRHDGQRVGRGASANIKRRRTGRRGPRAAGRDRRGAVPRARRRLLLHRHRPVRERLPAGDGQQRERRRRPRSARSSRSPSRTTARPWSRWRSPTPPTPRCPTAPTPRSARPRSRESPTATSTSPCPPSATGRRSPPAARSARPNTTSEVDLDQLFNTLDKPTVDHLKQVIHGFARRLPGGGRQGEPRLLLPEPVPLDLAARIRRAQLRPGQPRGAGRGCRRAHLDARSEEPGDLLPGREPERDAGHDRRPAGSPSPPRSASCPTSCGSSTRPRSTSAPPSTTSSRSSTPPGRWPPSSNPSPSGFAASPATPCPPSRASAGSSSSPAPPTT